MRTYRPTQKPSREFPLWLSLVLALLAGLVFVFALAPYKIWGIAILSPLVLYALLLPKITAGRAFLTGLAYGFGVWASGAFWLYTSIHQYGQVGSVLAFIMVAMMAVVMGLFHAGAAWLFVRFCGRQPLAFASLWVLQEWAKTWVLTGFPWLFVGYAYAEVPFITSLAPLVGVLGIGFVSVLFSASLVEIFRQKVGFLLIAMSFVVAAIVLDIVNPNFTTPTGKKLSVSLVQGNVNQDIKWQMDFQEEIIANHARLSQEEWGRDLILWSEASITMFEYEAREFLDAVDAHAKAHNSAFITGIPYADLEKFNEATDLYPPFYNSLMAYGAGTGIYKKQHLVPFGEYVPMRGLFNILPNLANNQQVMNHSKGDKVQAPLMVKNHPAGVAICYEVAYPATVRQNAKNSEFMLTVSNDAWFGTSSGPHQHLQMVQMRALETGRWFARATNTGVTALIDDKGRIVKRLPQFQEGVLRGNVVLRSGVTPYVKWGDYPVLGAVGVLALLSFWAGRNERYFRKDGKFFQDYR